MPNPKKRRPTSRHPTDEEEESRIAFARTLLATRQYKHQMKIALRQFIARQRHEAGLKIEAVCAKTLESYIARAREANRAVVDRQIQEQITESVAFYETIIRDLKAPIRDRLLAQQRIDAVLGTEAPKRTEITGGGGAPNSVTTTGTYSNSNF